MDYKRFMLSSSPQEDNRKSSTEYLAEQKLYRGLMTKYLSEVPDRFSQMYINELKKSNVDLEALQVAIISGIQTWGGQPTNPEFIEYIIAERGIDNLLNGLSTVIEGVRPEGVYEGAVTYAVGQRVDKDLVQLGFQEHLRSIEDPSKRLAQFKNYAQQEMAIDESSLQYQMTELLHYLGKKYPEKKSKVEQLYLQKIDVAEAESKSGFGGIHHSDDELDPEKYPDLEIESERSLDNVVSGEVFHTLDRLRGWGDEATIEYLLEFYQRNSVAYIPKIASVCSDIDPILTVKKIQEMGLTESKDKFIRKGANGIWHRLELGRIGVNNDVVDYIGKLYELQGEKAEKVVAAQRLTNDGKIGVFDNNEGLLGFFELGNLTKEEKKPLRY